MANPVRWLWSLSDADLARLEVGLVSGRMRPGDSGMVLRSMGLPAEWAPGLAGLRDWPVSQLLQVMGALRTGRPDPAASIQVVRTSPGAGLDGWETATVLRSLFTQAQRELWIAGFRVTDRSLFEPLAARGDDGLKVRLVVDLDPGVDVFGRPQRPHDPGTWPRIWRQRFLEHIWPDRLPAPELLYAPGGIGRSMHAKTVVVDRARWLVTSANFTSRGQERNVELGALIEDRGAAERAALWFEEAVGAGAFVEVPAALP